MLKVFTLKECLEWDALVKTFSAHDIYYLSGYVKAFQIHGDGEPLLFYYEDEDLRGINVVMKRDISKDPHFEGRLPENRYFDFATPYGYGGWLLEGDTSHADRLVEQYGNWCREHCIVSEFVRYHPVLKNHEAMTSFYEVIGLGHTIAMDLSSAESIWENLTSKNRNMVRKAQKNGIRIGRAGDAGSYEVFREIYNATMDKDHAAEYYYFAPGFYQSIEKDLAENAQIFYAELNGQMIAASIMLYANGRMSYHLSGSKKEYQHLAPTNLLLYEAALWGCTNGCRTLHLGGGVGSREDSLYGFKKSFYRKEPCRFHIGKKIWNQDIYQELLHKREGELNTNFFPIYRG